MQKQINNALFVKVNKDGNVYYMINDGIDHKNKVVTQITEGIKGDEFNTVRFYNLPKWNYRILSKLSVLEDLDAQFLEIKYEENKDVSLDYIKKLLLKEGWEHSPEETLVLAEVHVCKACKSKIAEWFYMPSGDGDRYYCEDCVPRGCSCNRYYKLDNFNPEEDERTLKFFDDDDNEVTEKEEWKYFVYVNEDGVQSPCCEYMYEEKGFWF